MFLKEYLLEKLWSVLRDQDGVDPAQLGVDLETQVGEHLCRGPGHVLGLDALRRYAQHAVPHPLDLGVHRGLAGQHHNDQLQVNKLLPEKKAVKVLAKVWKARTYEQDQC